MITIILMKQTLVVGIQKIVVKEDSMEIEYTRQTKRLMCLEKCMVNMTS